MENQRIRRFADVDQLNRFAAEEFIRLSSAAISERGRFTVALSGGSTPKKLFQLLASDEFRERIDLPRIHFFFGDERNVPITSDKSNFRMADENLFSKLNIPAASIHRFHTEIGDPAAIAADMEEDIRSLFALGADEAPCFDLVFLGMGADGHTASLFPGTMAIDERKRLVVENFIPKFDSFRLTFTYQTINNARNIMFLVTGEDKAAALREVLHGTPDVGTYPSQGIRPIHGQLMFLLDQKAASDL